MNKQENKVPRKAKKTVGTRVTDEEYIFIHKKAKLENLTQSQFVMKSMYTHTNLKKHKATLKESLLYSLMNPVLLFEPEKRKIIQEALHFIDK